MPRKSLSDDGRLVELRRLGDSEREFTMQLVAFRERIADLAS